MRTPSAPANSPVPPVRGRGHTVPGGRLGGRSRRLQEGDLRVDPAALLIIAAATFLLLFLMTGSVLIPLGLLVGSDSVPGTENGPWSWWMCLPGLGASACPGGGVGRAAKRGRAAVLGAAASATVPP